MQFLCRRLRPPPPPSDDCPDHPEPQCSLGSEAVDGAGVADVPVVKGVADCAAGADVPVVEGVEDRAVGVSVPVEGVEIVGVTSWLDPFNLDAVATGLARLDALGTTTTEHEDDEEDESEPHEDEAEPEDAAGDAVGPDAVGPVVSAHPDTESNDEDEDDDESDESEEEDADDGESDGPAHPDDPKAQPSDDDDEDHEEDDEEDHDDEDSEESDEEEDGPHDDPQADPHDPLPSAATAPDAVAQEWLFQTTGVVASPLDLCSFRVEGIDRDVPELEAFVVQRYAELVASERRWTFPLGRILAQYTGTLPQFFSLSFSNLEEQVFKRPFATDHLYDMFPADDLQYFECPDDGLLPQSILLWIDDRIVRELTEQLKPYAWDIFRCGSPFRPHAWGWLHHLMPAPAAAGSAGLFLSRSEPEGRDAVQAQLSLDTWTVSDRWTAQHHGWA